ncbi:hypothetical protein GCM10018952_18140 [Streptosporangium vulgare]
MADHTREALDRLPAGLRDSARLVFTAHSIPTSMAATAGPGGGAYEAQLRRAAALVTAEVRGDGEGEGAWDLVWQSRSGAPHIPWLEPDVCDHLLEVDAPAVVLVPIGFVSDHMEVVYDLDVEAAETAKKIGLPLVRATTAGTHPRFVSMVGELLAEPEPTGCAATCCPAPPRRRG